MDSQETHSATAACGSTTSKGWSTTSSTRSPDRYDLMNDLMSVGLHRLWKDLLVAKVAPPRHRPFRHLDVAGGTGDVAFRVAERAASSTRVTVADINADMLRVGEKRARPRNARATGSPSSRPTRRRCRSPTRASTATRSPSASATCRASSLRSPRPIACCERGGRFLCLEFSRVDPPGLDRLYEAYSDAVIPAHRQGRRRRRRALSLSCRIDPPVSDAGAFRRHDRGGRASRA